MSKVPMTNEGVTALKNELERRKLKDRPRIVEAIATARALGDLKENAEYHAAREEHGFNEGRIQEIEGKLSNAQIIDVTKINNQGKIIFGATVTIMHVKNDIEVTYRIVGEDEADIKLNKISYTSPIGRALIGKSEGDSVMVDTPDGGVEYEVVEVKYV